MKTFDMVIAGLAIAGAGALAWTLYSAFSSTEAPPPPAPPVPTPATGAKSSDSAYEKGQRIAITLMDIGNGKMLREEAAGPFIQMVEAARRDGVIISVTSAFRTMAEQQRLYDCYITKKCNNGNLAAKPGYSTHQSGRSVDLNTGSGLTARLGTVYRWLAANAGKYGFKNDVASEPWHWTYYGPLKSNTLAGTGFGISPLVGA